MLRIWVNKSAQGLKDYHTQSLKRDDNYYHEGLEVAGQWGGKTATMLGLEGEIHQKDFFALCDNLNPKTGEQLTPRMKANRRIAYDFVFSAPKAISVLYELSGDERILDAFRKSVRETMQEAESEMQTRARKSGKDEDRVTGNMVWGEYLHFTNRPSNETDFGFGEFYAGTDDMKKAAETMAGYSDPHLHAHCVAFNVTYDPVEKRYKAGQFGDLKRDGYYYEDAFHTRFAKRLNELGYSTEKKGNSFSLAQAPQSLTDKFSRRRNEIERDAREKGITDAEGKHEIARRGRQKKTKAKNRAEMRELWGSVLSPNERAFLSETVHGEAKPTAIQTPEQARDYALEHLFERHSAIAEKRVLAEMLSYGIGSVQPEEAKATLNAYRDLIRVKHDGEIRVTTKGVLESEVAYLQFAIDGQRKFKPLLPSEQIRKHFFPNLSEEQKKAAVHIVTSRDRITGVIGKAGAGKTTMMRATRDALESEPGRHVYAFAPSSQASRNVLAKGGFKDATTLATLLKDEQLQEKLKGQIIWVDEAGQISSKDMKRLMDVVKKGNNRLILSGDYTQHTSVEAGDSFRLLEKEAGIRFAKLTEIRRQTEPGYKKAVELIAEGTGKAAQKGFDALDRMGHVIEAAGEERHQMLVSDYLKAREEGKSALIIAPTHAEGDKLTAQVRAEQKAQGFIGEERIFKARTVTNWTVAQRGDARNYEPGMVVEFNKAIAGTRKRIEGNRITVGGFEKGEFAVVTETSADGVMVLKQDGTRAELPGRTNRFEVYRTRELGIAKGDVIRNTKNGEMKVDGQAKGTRVNNGDIWVVQGINKDGSVRLPGGKTMPKDWGHFTYGYVDTSYASQGKTVDRVFISVGKESLPAANQQQWYVSASRGREQAKLYVEDKQDVRDAVARTGQRLSAVELTKTKLRPSWRHRFYESLERNMVGRFLRNRANAIKDYWQERNKGLSYAG
jgi:energy-coupling factor transporter ATP-binding protein EcfA2